MSRYPARVRSMAPAASGSWQEVINETLTGVSANFKADHTRQAFYCDTTGTKVRITFEAGTGGGKKAAVDNISIGTQNSGPDTTATPVEILFSAGSGFALDPGSTIVSDELVFDVSSGSTYIVCVDHSGSNSYFQQHTVSGTFWVSTSANGYNAATMPGGRSSNTGFCGVQKVEVWVDA